MFIILSTWKTDEEWNTCLEFQFVAINLCRLVLFQCHLWQKIPIIKSITAMGALSLYWYFGLGAEIRLRIETELWCPFIKRKFLSALKRLTYMDFGRAFMKEGLRFHTLWFRWKSDMSFAFLTNYVRQFPILKQHFSNCQSTNFGRVESSVFARSIIRCFQIAAVSLIPNIECGSPNSTHAVSFNDPLSFLAMEQSPLFFEINTLLVLI